MNIEQINKIISATEEELQNAVKNNVVPYQIEMIEKNLSHYRLKKKQLEMGLAKQTSMTAKEVLQKLDSLDYTKDPYDEVKALFKELPYIPSMVHILQPIGAVSYPDSLIRARPYLNTTDKPFELRSDLSFKPQDYNKKYQRASTPKKTVFYGCLKRFNGELIMTEEGDVELDNRYVATLEAVRAISITDNSAYVKIAYGKFFAIKPIQVIGILNHSEFHSSNTKIKEYYQKWLEQVKKLGMEDDAVAIMDYFADKFSDENAGEEKEHLYMLSAMFAEVCMLHPGIDGVMYPSVRTAGQGICVAVSTDTANNKLMLDVAGESLIYKHKGKSVIDNLSIVTEINNAASFKFGPAPTKYVMGEPRILKGLGVKSIDELKI